MSATTKSHLWTRGLLLLSVLFCVWGISLIVSANRLQAEVSVDVGLVSRLNELKQSISELEGALAEGKSEAASASPDLGWQQLRAEYRARAEAFDLNRPEIQEIRPLLVKVDSLVARMDRIYLGTLASQEERASHVRAEADFREARRQAIDEVESATQTVRRHLTVLSENLAAKWRYLNEVAVVSSMRKKRWSTSTTNHLCV